MYSAICGQFYSKGSLKGREGAWLQYAQTIAAQASANVRDAELPSQVQFIERVGLGVQRPQTSDSGADSTFRDRKPSTGIRDPARSVEQRRHPVSLRLERSAAYRVTLPAMY
jgi:hypothetical protein